MVIHLNPQVFEHRHALGVGNGVDSRADFLNSEARMRAVIGNWNRTKDSDDFLKTLSVFINPGGGVALVLNKHANHGREHPSIGAGLHSQVNVGHFRRLGNHRIDNNHGLIRILRKITQEYTCPRYTVGVPRVFTEEKRNVTMVEVAFHHGSKHLAVDPELTGLFLRQGTRAIRAAENRPSCA